MPPKPHCQRITIKHPGYGRNNTLFALPACDGAGAGGKAHYATVHSACTIIANNRQDGWLSSSLSGEPRTHPDSEGLVPAGVYYLHFEPESTSQPYPIVPNFRSWAFPHNDLPSLWQELAQGAAATESRTGTETCRLTKKRLACENAHIIPAVEKSWFADNEMDQYSELGGRTGQDVADSPSNLIRLRRDVHSLWDGLFFSILPKESQYGEDVATQWRAHGMVEDEELILDYHNMPLQSLAGRSVQYFYARFAWDIFPKLLGFLQGTQSRRLAVRLSDGVVDVRSFSPQGCRRFTEGQGRGRSASPIKRSRGPDGNVLEYMYSTGKESSSTAKRKKGCTSSAQSPRQDSVLSDFDSSSDPEWELTPNGHSTTEYWALRGWAVQPHEHDIEYCRIDSDQERGRKRRRSPPDGIALVAAREAP